MKTKRLSIIMILISFFMSSEGFAQYLDPMIELQYQMQMYNNMLNQMSKALEGVSQQQKQSGTTQSAIIPTYPINHNQNGKSESCVGYKTCSMCNGKGWVPGFKTATYGDMSRYWCTECHEEVGASHSHDQCPSCRGTGKTVTIK